MVGPAVFIGAHTRTGFNVALTNCTVGDRQGFTLVHVSAQHEPLLSLKAPNTYHEMCLR